MMSQHLAFVAAFFVILGVLKCNAQDCKANQDKKWYYDNSLPNGPDHWGDVGYPKCNGKKQSPIDIQDSDAEPIQDSQGLRVANYDQPLSKVIITNSGHTVQVVPDDDIKRTVTVFGVPYILKAFFLFWGNQETSDDGTITATPGSDHTIDGKQYAMEMQLVHEKDGSDDNTKDGSDDNTKDGNSDDDNKEGGSEAGNKDGNSDDDNEDGGSDDDNNGGGSDDKDGSDDNNDGDGNSDGDAKNDNIKNNNKKKVIISVLFEISDAAPNTVIAAIQNKIGEYEYENDVFNGDLDDTKTIDLSNLVADKSEYYQYNGSIPIPPCTQTVMYYVLKTTSTVSNQQSLNFQKLYSVKKEDDAGDDTCHIVDNFRPTQQLNGREIVSG